MPAPHPVLCRVLGLSLCLLGLAAGQEVVIPFGSTWSYLKGNAPQPAQWRDLSFDDSLWLEGETPIGYGDPPIKTELSDMMQVTGGSAGYASVFLRKKFEIIDPFPLQKMTFSITYDDGFVAYLNGVYLIHKNMASPNNPPHNVLASADHEYSTDVIDASSAIARLVAGENVLAVQVHNISLTSSDLYFDVKLEVENRPDPFQCIGGLQCADLGDGVVEFKWTRGASPADLARIREGDQVVLEVSATGDRATLSDVAAGDHWYRLFGVKGGEDCYGGACRVAVGAVQKFVRGDVSDDGRINILDPLFLAHYVFQLGEAPTCLDSGDFDDDGRLNIGDIIALLAYLFESGNAPKPPFGAIPLACGPDEVLDQFPKCEYSHCQ